MPRIAPHGGAVMLPGLIRLLAVDLPPQTVQRYLEANTPSQLAFWQYNQKLLSFPAGVHDDMLDSMARIYDIQAVFPKGTGSVRRAAASELMSLLGERRSTTKWMHRVPRARRAISRSAATVRRGPCRRTSPRARS